MKYLPALAVVCLLIGPSVASAQQLPGDPNPHGTTVTVTDYNHNWLKPYSNSGTIQINSGAHLENKAGVVSHATLANESTGTINNDGKYSDDLVSGEAAVMENYGTFNNNSGATLYSHGTFKNEDGSTLNNTGTFQSRYLRNNGTLNNIGTFETIGSATLQNYGTISNSGTWEPDVTWTNYSGGTFDNSGTLTNKHTLTNDGTLTFQAGSTFDNTAGGTLNNSGTIESYIDDYWQTLAIGAGGTVHFQSGSTFVNHATITNKNTGRALFNAWTLDNYDTLTNDGEIFNTGTLTNNNGATLANNSGATLYNYGTIDTTNGTFTNNGTLNGSGHIIGSFIDHGHIKPGNSAGVMTIDGDYFKVEGSHEIELGGLFDYDRIDVTGNVELAGLLNVKLIDGFELHRGNWFDFLTVGGTLSGQYDGLGEGDLVGKFGGQDLFIGYSYSGEFTGVALYTNAVPEPTTVLIWSMLAGLGMTVRRRR